MQPDGQTHDALDAENVIRGKNRKLLHPDDFGSRSHVISTRNPPQISATAIVARVPAIPRSNTTTLRNT